ncbi:MAG: OsmC family protein [Bacteroidetes bacterium]|nr:OsmC family protein [Bacteroidota bacterium]
MENQASTSTTQLPLEVTMNLVNDKLHIIGKAGNNEPIHTDYIPPYGDNLGYMPLQLFLMSLGTCASGSILLLLRKMQKTINGLEVKASGVRRQTHPTSFEEVSLEFILTSPDVKAADMEKVIDMSEASICPVWAMIKGNVTVKTSFRIISPLDK